MQSLLARITFGRNEVRCILFPIRSSASRFLPRGGFRGRAPGSTIVPPPHSQQTCKKPIFGLPKFPQRIPTKRETKFGPQRIVYSGKDSRTAA